MTDDEGFEADLREVFGERVRELSDTLRGSLRGLWERGRQRIVVSINVAAGPDSFVNTIRRIQEGLFRSTGLSQEHFAGTSRELSWGGKRRPPRESS